VQGVSEASEARTKFMCKVCENKARIKLSDLPDGGAPEVRKLHENHCGSFSAAQVCVVWQEVVQPGADEGTPDGQEAQGTLEGLTRQSNLVLSASTCLTLVVLSVSTRLTLVVLSVRCTPDGQEAQGTLEGLTRQSNLLLSASTCLIFDCTAMHWTARQGTGLHRNALDCAATLVVLSLRTCLTLAVLSLRTCPCHS
jgi:hypothetical protein